MKAERVSLFLLFFFFLKQRMRWLHCRIVKGTMSRDFRILVCFHESVSPKPRSIPVGPFRFFSKICEVIRSSRCTTAVFDTGGKWKKSSIIKVLTILFGHLWEVELTYRYIFAFKFTLRSQQPGIVPIICHRCCWYRWQIASGVVDTGGILPPLSLTSVANLPTVSTILAKLVAKFAAHVVDTVGNFVTSVIDTGDKFPTSVVDTGGSPWLANISANFRKNSKGS